MHADSSSDILEVTELLLRSPSTLVARLREDALRSRALPLQLALIASVGFAVFGFLLGLTRSPLTAAVGAPKLVAVALGALAICLPSLYAYARVMGHRAGALEIVCESLVALATTGATLLAVSPLWLVLSRFLSSQHPFGYFHVMLAAVALLAFAGVRGVAVLVRCLRAEKRGVAHLIAWAALYGLVGLQLGWVLRPFVGTPHDGERNTVALRPLEGSAFDATGTLVGSNLAVASGGAPTPRTERR